MAQPRVVTKSISAQNIFSNSLVVLNEPFNFSLSGTWVATIHLQRSFDNGLTWLDTENFNVNVERIGLEPEVGTLYRFGVKTGNYTSGTIVGRLSW